jgi:hypothetical protein
MSRAKTVAWWKTELSFDTKKDLEAAIRKVVNGIQLNTPMNPKATAFFTKILQHHHEFDSKKGAGIKHLEIRENILYRKVTRGIWIVRVDGSEVSISWVNALKPGGAPSLKETISRAAREEISYQIDDFKVSDDLTEVCDICGEELHGNTHVDHVINFDTIFSNFLKEKNMSYNDIKTDETDAIGVFIDRDLANEWREYHELNATLRRVHGGCNLSRSRQ